jgi:arabinogalactan oligomer/maltooligosaccharide transport system permease protein
MNEFTPAILGNLVLGLAVLEALFFLAWLLVERFDRILRRLADVPNYLVQVAVLALLLVGGWVVTDSIAQPVDFAAPDGTAVLVAAVRAFLACGLVASVLRLPRQPQRRRVWMIGLALAYVFVAAVYLALLVSNKLELETILNSLQQVVSTTLLIILAIITLEVALYLGWSLAERLARVLRPIGGPIGYLIQVGALLILFIGAWSAATAILDTLDIREAIKPLESDIVRGAYVWAVLSAVFGIPLILLSGLIVSLGALHRRRDLRLVYLLLAPAAIGLALLVIYPVLFELRLAFSNMSLRRFKEFDVGWELGLANLQRLFTEPVLQQQTFFPVFGRTIVWTAVNVFLHVAGGMALALLLNRPMRGKGLYRTFLVLPWAVPQIIAVLAWRGEFHSQYGFVNILLTGLGLEPVQWLTDPTWNFVGMILVNVWLGIPFMMVILLGGLQSIAGEYYEAAEIDGASGYQQFRNITLPLLRPVMTPAIVLGTIWTFNNFNVPFLINQNELETSDILVTALFRAAFEYNRYGFAAMFAFVIFLILLVFSLIYIWRSGTLRGAYE